MKVANVAAAQWLHPKFGSKVRFASARPAYGIVDDQGRIYSHTGDMPSTWDRKYVAQAILDDPGTYLSDGTWLEDLS